MQGIKTIDIHVSNNDYLDEETKRILSEVNADAEINSTDDSKESKSEKKEYKPKFYTDDAGIQWETNSIEDKDSEW